MKASRILVFATTLAALAGCDRHERTPAAAPALKPVSVTTATATLTYAPRYIEVSGTVTPVARAELSARVPGYVAAVHAVLGQSVQKGDILVEISADEIRARLAQARAGLSRIARDLERERALLEKNASTPDLVRTLEDQKRQAEAAVREAETMLSYVRITAPFDGIVSRKTVDVGDFAGVGVPLLAIDRAEHLRVDTAIPESLAALAPGDALTIRWDGGETTGTLAEISAAADAATRTVAARIDLPADAPLRAGQFVRVLIPSGEHPILTVPATAVTRFGQIERAFVVEDGRARLRIVRTGGRHGDRIEILAGLSDGESVVAPPPAAIRDGQPVEVSGS